MAGRLLCAGLLVAGMTLPPTAHAQDPTWAGMAGAVLPLTVGPGDYVEGRITATAGRVGLTLTGPQGHALRQLSDVSAGTQSFRFLAAGGESLAVTGPGGAAFQLDLSRIVPPAAQVAPAQRPLSPKVAALADHLAAGGDTAAFWAGIAQQGTPLVENVNGRTVLTFLYRGARQGVRIFGGPSSDHDEMARLGHSDLWFRSYTVPAETRLSYQLAPDVPPVPGSARDRRVAILATAAADPLNLAPWPADAADRWNQSSTVSLPAAPDQPGQPVTTNADNRLEDLPFASGLLGNERGVTLYRPAGFDPADPGLVLLFVFDGPRAISEMQVPGVLDRLQAEGRLPPVAAVFIDAIDSDTRARELPGNPVFADAMAMELLPLVARTLGLRPEAARTVVAGASFGGIGAAHVALTHPEAFGNVISLSGSYWWSPEPATGDMLAPLPWMAERVLNAPPAPVRFFVTAGTFETARDGGYDIRETSRLFHAALRARGYDSRWREYAGGHDGFVWRGALADGLIALFGR